MLSSTLRRLPGQLRLLSRTSAVRADPWPLPHTPEHLASTTSPTDIPPHAPLPRPNEQVATLRARLVYQSRKRGTLESDLILSTFAREQLQGMSEPELREYDKVRASLCVLILIKAIHSTFDDAAARRGGLGHLLLGDGGAHAAGTLGEIPYFGEAQDPRAERRKGRAAHACAIVYAVRVKIKNKNTVGFNAPSENRQERQFIFHRGSYNKNHIASDERWKVGTPSRISHNTHASAHPHAITTKHRCPNPTPK